MFYMIKDNFLLLVKFHPRNQRTIIMFQVILQQSPRSHLLRWHNEPTAHFVTFTPSSNNFHAEAFPKSRKQVGDEYMCLNPLKNKEDQKKIADLNGLLFQDSFWERSRNDIYWDLLVEVHKKGPLDC